jgi:hypothetical protein
MRLKEYQQQLFERNDFRIERDQANFCVSRSPGAYSFISWLFDFAACVSRHNAFDAVNPQIDRFDAPEASTAKQCRFQFRCAA